MSSLTATDRDPESAEDATPRRSARLQTLRRLAAEVVPSHTPSSAVENGSDHPPFRPHATAANIGAPPLYELRGVIIVPLDILVQLVENSEFRLLAAWRATSKRLYRAVGAHLESRYHTCLRPFVDDVPAFNQLLIRHGAIVSGSVALRYFLPRATWLPNDLDIYVPDSEYEKFITAVTNPRGLRFSVFPNHLPWDLVPSRATTASSEADAVAVDGDTFAALSVAPSEVGDVASDVSIDSHLPSTHPGIREVRKFYSSTDCRVDIICAPSDNPVVALKQFWSPLLMNFLRPDGCVCGFPSSTLEGLGELKPFMSRRDAAAAAKYISRGFTLAADHYSQQDEAWESPFFGSPTALSMPYRRQPTDPRPVLPVVRTDRGWAISPLWPPTSGEYTRALPLQPT